MPVSYWAEHAWLSAGVASGVLITVDNGRFTNVVPVAAPPPDSVRLAGLTLPGLANAHSHAFHRALRGRTHGERGTFWTWRDRMYTLADRLDPAQYYDLARATYAEMALAGITTVGEFHYLHHGPGGIPYGDPNEMGHALLAAAEAAGIRITLLDTVYLSSTVDAAAPVGPQRRFSDGDLDAWSARVATLKPTPNSHVGAAIHSVRSVPAQVLTPFAALVGGLPVHVHLSEQRAENEACLARHGITPTQLLDAAGLLGPSTTAVHATHLTPADIATLGERGTNICFCPTTERDLADGIGPARALTDAGARLCLGSDSHAVIDIIEEARAVELDQRLLDEHRGNFEVAELIEAATRTGQAALGWTEAGAIAPGLRADLVTVRLDTVRAAGFDDPAPAVLFGSVAGDVTEVLVDGRLTVHEGQHVHIPDVPRALADAIGAAWARP